MIDEVEKSKAEEKKLIRDILTWQQNIGDKAKQEKRDLTSYEFMLRMNLLNSIQIILKESLYNESNLCY